VEAAGKRWIAHNSTTDVFTIWHISDIHIMNRACAVDRLRADVAEIAADPYAFWLGGGDYADFIGYTDKRFDPDSVAEDVTVKELGDLGRVGMQRVAKELAPIKEKCLGLLLGNHEKKYQQATEQESLHGWLCTQLGAPSLGYCCLFDIIFARDASVDVPALLWSSPGREFHRESFRVFAHHGAGFATTPGGKLNKLVQFMQSFDADLYFLGHVHDHVARKEPLLGADAACKTIIQRQRLGVIAGSYLKTYAQGQCTYGEQRGYRPVSLGAARASIAPDRRELHAAI